MFFLVYMVFNILLMICWIFGVICLTGFVMVCSWLFGNVNICNIDIYIWNVELCWNSLMCVGLILDILWFKW